MCSGLWLVLPLVGGCGAGLGGDPEVLLPEGPSGFPGARPPDGPLCTQPEAPGGLPSLSHPREARSLLSLPGFRLGLLRTAVAALLTLCGPVRSPGRRWMVCRLHRGRAAPWRLGIAVSGGLGAAEFWSVLGRGHLFVGPPATPQHCHLRERNGGTPPTAILRTNPQICPQLPRPRDLPTPCLPLPWPLVDAPKCLKPLTFAGSGQAPVCA